MTTILMILLALTGPLQDRDAAVTRTLDAWVEMWGSYDLDQVRKLFVDDGTVTYFSSEYGGLIQGIDPLVRHHAGFGFRAGGAPTGSRLWLEDVEIRWADGAALVLAQWLFTSADAPGGPQRGPVTFVLVARGGDYRIQHAHFADAPAEG
jgi:ketosteroid isomerase-like protein